MENDSMNKIFFTIDGKEEFFLKVEKGEIEFNLNGKLFRALISLVSVELEVVQKSKGPGCFVFYYRYNNGRPRDFLVIEGYTNERLAECCKNLELLEKENIRTELLEPFSFDG